MAFPPPTHPVVSVPSDAVLAAAELAAAKVLEKHVDSWLRGQGRALKPGLTVEVSIGERDRIKPGVLALLCGLYAPGTWAKASTAQDLVDAAGKVTGPDPRGIVLTLVPA